MPPKVKVTREEIIAAALELLRQKGMEAVNARAVASVLGCSTQPIFSNYSSMAALQQETRDAAAAEYSRWIEQHMKEGKYPPYKASGMAYISFARTRPQLFKELFMRDRTGDAPVGDDPLTRSIVALIVKTPAFPSKPHGSCTSSFGSSSTASPLCWSPATSIWRSRSSAACLPTFTSAC